MLINASIMNTVDIFKTLSKNPITKKIFIGVFASDKLPKLTQRPACLVVNTDPSNLPGTHWIAIFIPNKGKSIFFDSYGRFPWDDRFRKFLKNSNNKGYTYNGKKIQSNFSNLCGQYCCTFLYAKCKGQNMRSFMKIFQNNKPLENDKKIKKMFLRCFKKTKHA